MARNAFKSILIMFFVTVFFIGSVHATTIEFVATDLADTTAGEDLWEYTYTVSDHTFAVDTGFAIFFDYRLYGAIDPDPVSPNSDWDVISWHPDASKQKDGGFDAMALIDGATTEDSFSVSFVWLGKENLVPGSQDFEIYDANMDPLEPGSTVPAAVPEPATIVLFGMGLVGFAGFRRGAKYSAA